jgi:ribosomal protein S18 acetylase RimI-like enzyme
MEVRSLAQTPLKEIVDCLSLSFSDYFVQMPGDTNYWKKRWKGARVDYRASYGMFDNGQLVGFIIHGIDFWKGIFTAFNTGTGVIPSYRGQKIVQKMYGKAIPELKDRGVQVCALEVIQKNEKAIRAYKGVGFSISRELKCYRGTISAQNKNTIQLKKRNLQFFDWDTYQGQHFYSWDHVQMAILLQEKDYELYEVAQDLKSIGYFIINPKTGYLAQFDLLDRRYPHHWDIVMEGIAQVSSSLKILNIDPGEKSKIKLVENLGFDNYISQFEMEMDMNL